MQAIKDVVDTYESFVIRNAGQVGAAEQLVLGIFYIVPSGMSNTRIKMEGVYTLIKLVTLYHDTIFIRRRRQETIDGKFVRDHRKKVEQEIDRTRSAERGAPNTQGHGAHQEIERKLDNLLQALHKPIPHPLAPKWWERTAVALSFLSAIELLLEMFAYTKKKQMKTVFIIELMKSLLRFYLLLRSKGSVLALQRVPPRDMIGNLEATSEENVSNGSVSSFPAGNRTPKRPTLMDIAKKNNPKASSNWEEQWKREYHSNLPRSEIYIPSSPNTYTFMGEFLWIIRPLVYVLAMSKFGKTSWKAWLSSFLVDVASRFCSSQNAVHFTECEKEEMSERMKNWLFYLFRSPFLEDVICPFLKKLPIPKCVTHGKIGTTLAGPISTAVESYKEFYFYTAGSD